MSRSRTSRAASEKPSDYFKRNIKLTFLRDTVTIRTHDLLGAETLMFQTATSRTASAPTPTRAPCATPCSKASTKKSATRSSYHNAAELYGFRGSSCPAISDL